MANPVAPWGNAQFDGFADRRARNGVLADEHLADDLDLQAERAEQLGRAASVAAELAVEAEHEGSRAQAFDEHLARPREQQVTKFSRVI